MAHVTQECASMPKAKEDKRVILIEYIQLATGNRAMHCGKLTKGQITFDNTAACMYVTWKRRKVLSSRGDRYRAKYLFADSMRPPDALMAVFAEPRMTR